MTQKIILKGVPPYNGEYDIPTSFTNDDWRDMLRIADVTPLEFQHELERGNQLVMVALAYIAVKQSGQFPKIDEQPFWDADSGEMADISDPEETGDPPPNATGTLGSRSGSPSHNGSGHPEPTPEPTGPHSSVSAALDRMISEP